MRFDAKETFRDILPEVKNNTKNETNTGTNTDSNNDTDTGNRHRHHRKEIVFCLLHTKTESDRLIKLPFVGFRPLHSISSGSILSQSLLEPSRDTCRSMKETGLHQLGRVFQICRCQ